MNVSSMNVWLYMIVASTKRFHCGKHHKWTFVSTKMLMTILAIFLNINVMCS